MASAIPPPPPTTTPNGGIQGRELDPFMEGLPARFGKYTLIRKLATGGMAELFLAIQRSVAGFEKLLVIKRILPAMNNDRAFIDMLLHEARIAATLSHPNIVQIFDVGCHENNYYIAMEHVHGEDLRQIVRQMKKKGVAEFPLEHALSILMGMCAGLAYAHEKRDLDGSELNIVHRDISPQNVVVTFTGDVKIVDFGIAKSDAKLHTDTRSGKLKGKIPYMSPEQARGEAVDHRSDIFAAGVMLFELTTGKRLFKANSEFETLKLICEREYPRPTQVRGGYPQELEDIVMRALAKKREDRFQSAREMQQAIEYFARRERIPTSTIALTTFMQSLFEDKLASQKEELLQGKQLADIIASQAPSPESTMELDALRQSGGHLSMPAAANTVTGVGAARKSKTGLFAFGALGAAALVAAGVGGTILAVRQPASSDATGARVAPAAGGGANATDTAATPSAPATRGAVLVQSDPAGAAITVNGEALSEVTPTTLKALPIGTPIEIVVSKEGYADARETVTLTDDAPSSAIRLAMKHGTMSFEIVMRPQLPGAGIILDRKSVGALTADNVSSGEQHTVVVYAPGYNSHSFTFTGTAGEKKQFPISLVKLNPKDKDKDPAVAGATTTAAPPPVTGTGTLSVGARGGWCNVTVDGVGRGPTPVRITVPAGNHSISCTTESGKTLSGGAKVDPDGRGGMVFTIPQ